MEIDAVAECNAASINSRRKFKTPLFPNLPGLWEHESDVTKPISNLYHNRETESIATASLLAISDSAELDRDLFFRKKVKGRKRSSGAAGDQFGPWLFHEKWRPRKTAGQSRNRSEKRQSGQRNSSLSPTRSSYVSPDERHLTKSSKITFHHKNNGILDLGNKVNDTSYSRGHDPEEEHHHANRIFPVTASGQTQIQTLSSRDDSHEMAYDSEEVQTYPKHSLPTVITLKPANSGDCYDTVFSLGKSSLSSKDIIISMGQNNRLSTHYKRQTKSAISSNVQAPYNINSSPAKSFEEDEDDIFGVRSRQGGIGDTNAVDPYSGGRNKPAAPMCEFLDISQHIRYYRIHHTVRLTGRFSPANDKPAKKKIQSVQWKDVFPDRPLSTTGSSANRVPVFRFSVNDFRQEPMTLSIEKSRDLKDLPSSSDPDGSSLKRQRSRQIRSSAATSAGEIYPHSANAIGSSSRRDPGRKREAKKISLSPTVVRVVRSPRSSMSPDGMEEEEADTNFWKSRAKCRQLKSAPSEIQGQRFTDDRATREHNESNTPIATTNNKNNDKDFDSKKEEVNPNRHYDDGYPIDLFQNKTFASTERQEIIDSNPPLPKNKGDKSANPDVPACVSKPISKLSKTQEYIQSTYSIYNDTIRNIHSSDSSQVTIYKEYMKRKKSLASFSQRESDVDGTRTPARDRRDPSTSDDNYESIKSRFKSPHKFSYILRDLMGYSRQYKSPVGHLESRNSNNDEDDRVTSALDEEDQRRERSAAIRSKPTLNIDTRQLRDSVERKVYEGNRFLMRPFTSRFVDYNDRFVQFLVKEERDLKSSLFKRRGQYTSRRNAKEPGVMLDENEFGHRNLSRESSPERNNNIGTATTYDLNASCDTVPTELSENSSKIKGGLYINTRSSSSPSPENTHEKESSGYLTNTKKVWIPSASRWRQKLPVRPETQPTSAFHFKPTSSSSSTAYVIATPPLQMGFDNRGVVLPLDDFVHMAMKSRESSFTALSQSVNAGSKVGIAPNSTVGRAKSVRKAPDDGLVRVVSFATPVNQFIFAKRITGYSSTDATSGTTSSVTAEDAGRNVFQRKTTGTFRLSLSDVKQGKPIFVSDSSKNTNQNTNDKGVDGGGESGDTNDLKMAENNYETTSANSAVDKNTLEIEKDGIESLSTKLQHKDKTDTNNNISKREKSFRKIDIDINSLLNSVELKESCQDKDNTNKGDLELQNHSYTEAISLNDKNRIHSALRSKVVHLAEMKSSQDVDQNNIPKAIIATTTATTTMHSDETAQGDLSKEQPSQLYSSPEDDKFPNNEVGNKQATDSLASKFSQLRQRRKNAFRRNNMINKQTSYVRRSLPEEMHTPTSDSSTLSLNLNLNSDSTDVIRAEGSCPWKEASRTKSSLSSVRENRSSQGPKTVRFASSDEVVRFACDEMDASDWSKADE